MIPDDVYIRKAIEGNDEAFDKLIKRHHPKIYEGAQMKWFVLLFSVVCFIKPSLKTPFPLVRLLNLTFLEVCSE